jgi:short-subunit dehydrogenase
VRISGSFAVVTGASSGIGRAVALRLAAADCRLWLVGRDPARLAEVADATGGEVVVADLADPAATEELGQRLADLDPGPDLLVNNAGIGAVGSAAAPAPDGADLDLLLTVNLLAPVRLTQAVLPGMLARGRGQLAYVTSIAGLLGVADESAYASVKGALHRYAASVRVEVAGGGVGVTAVAPGVVETEFFARRGSLYTRRFPRPISAERVAAALVGAVERDRAEVIVPAWLRVPVVLQAVAPSLYARLAGRAG